MAGTARRHTLIDPDHGGVNPLHKGVGLSVARSSSSISSKISPSNCLIVSNFSLDRQYQL